MLCLDPVWQAKMDAQVSTILHSPCGQFVYIATYDSLCKLEAGNGKKEVWRKECEECQWEGGIFLALAVSPDGKAVYFGGSDYKLTSVNAETGEQVWKTGELALGGYMLRVLSLAVADGGKTLLAGSVGGFVRVATDTGKVTTETESSSMCNCICCSPDGKHIVTSFIADGKTDLVCWKLPTDSSKHAEEGAVPDAAIDADSDAESSLPTDKPVWERAWTVSLSEQVFAVTLSRCGGMMFLGVGQKVTALDWATQALLWECRREDKVNSITLAQPHGDTLFVAGDDSMVASRDSRHHGTCPLEHEAVWSSNLDIMQPLWAVYRHRRW